LKNKNDINCNHFTKINKYLRLELRQIKGEKSDTWIVDTQKKLLLIDALNFLNKYVA
jgi:hypothetical protein